MNREKVTELLKNYRSYRYAVSNGIAAHEPNDTVGMPMGFDYGPRSPKGFGERGNTIQSAMDYQQYKRAVEMIDGAVKDVLDDAERDIIELKYMNRNVVTLELIANRKGLGEKTVRIYHKRALKKLSLALRFVEVPEIINLDDVVKITV